ncbi:MAG TPA: hypothetical protein VGA60_01465 [Kiloniellales bacterium]|jgi:hypothetical protein
MHAVNGIQNSQGSMSIQSMAFRPRRPSFQLESQKWTPRKTVLFVFASSTFLWTGIATAAWLIH